MTMWNKTKAWWDKHAIWFGIGMVLFFVCFFVFATCWDESHAKVVHCYLYPSVVPSMDGTPARFRIPGRFDLYGYRRNASDRPLRRGLTQQEAEDYAASIQCPIFERIERAR